MSCVKGKCAGVVSRQQEGYDFEATTVSNSPTISTDPCTPEDITEDEGDSTGTNTNNVWQYFKKLCNGTESVACDYCNKKLEGSSENETSHLHVHLKRCGNVRRDF